MTSVCLDADSNSRLLPHLATPRDDDRRRRREHDPRMCLSSQVTDTEPRTHGASMCRPQAASSGYNTIILTQLRKL
jgi:hypothetical protein